MVLAQLIGRNDGDLLLLVELLVQLLVFAGDVLDVDQTLVLSQHGQEVHGAGVEWGDGFEGLVKFTDFFQADTAVFGELSEHLGVGVEFGKVHHVLVHVEESGLLGGSGEQNVGVATFDGVFIGRCFVVWGGINSSNITKIKLIKQALIQIKLAGKLGPWGV